VARVGAGEEIWLDVRDGFDAQITRASKAHDLATLDLARGHSMTGPIAVNGVRPGDRIDVEICAIEPGDWGYTAVLPGIGLLGDSFPEPFLVHWELSNGVARSPQMPGVAIRGRPFLGVVAVAPSETFIDSVTTRERALSEISDLVMLPDPTSAQPPVGEPAQKGLRTLPPRENGGNLDIRHLTSGSRVSFTAQVDDALCSVGDPHFAQGDGESCGLAIETSARVALKLHVQKAGSQTARNRMPVVSYETPAQAARSFIAATGIPVDSGGTNRYMDVYEAARGALSEMVAYLSNARGLTPEQAYVLASVAADLQISEIVNAPNPLVSAVMPLDVFERT
jgi:formamidase